MLTDGFTVAAQLVNFIVLVWLLKRFLYQPVLDAVDAREARVAKDLADAAAARVEAERQREAYEAQQAALAEQRSELLATARADGERERERLLNAAREEAEAARARWLTALRNEQTSLHHALAQRAREEVFAIARQVLTDLAMADLDERIVAVFVERLGRLDAADAARLAAALSDHDAAVRVRSAFELSPTQQAAIRAAVARLGTVRALRFEVAPNLVGGVELTAGGQRVGWSVSEYLLTLESGVAQLLDEAAA